MATYVDSDTFKVSGDQTGDAVTGRRVQFYCGDVGYVWSEITSSSYNSGSDETTINIDDGVLTSELESAWVGAVEPGSEGSLPLHTHSGDEQGGTVSHNNVTDVAASDHHTKYALTDDLASGEITQIQNIDSVTITNTQWGYLGAMGGQPLESEANDLTSSVTWADVPDGNITQSGVTQHESALTIAESQITGLDYYTDSDVDGQDGRRRENQGPRSGRGCACVPVRCRSVRVRPSRRRGSRPSRRRRSPPDRGWPATRRRIPRSYRVASRRRWPCR